MADFARSDHPAVQAQLDRLALVSPAGDRLGLDRVRALLDRLGRPQDRLPPVFHVAGTNGKGSVCAFLRAAVEAAGHTAHVFTSPHLVRFNERIRLAGRLIEDDRLAALLEQVIDSGADIQPSFFEVTAAAAFLAFAQDPADACILEVGLGGRLDATNVVDRPAVCGIAGLGLDHQPFLGRRLVDIAGEKAGIAKRDVPLVTQAYHPRAAQRIAQVAQAAGAPLFARGQQWEAAIRRTQLHVTDRAGSLALPLPRLAGQHQARNAALAVAMIRHQRAVAIPDAALRAAMGWAEWPARIQRLSEGPLLSVLPRGSELWLDGGHNPAAARAVAAHFRHAFADDLPLVLVFASLTSKDPRATLRALGGIVSEIRTVPIPGHDCFHPAELERIARLAGFLRVEACADLDAALRSVRAPARVLVFGSLYLAGQVLAANGNAPD